MLRLKFVPVVMLALVLASCGGDKEKERKENAEPTTVEWIGRDGPAETHGLIIILEVTEGKVTSGMLRPYDIGADTLEHFGVDAPLRNIVQHEHVVTFDADTVSHGKTQVAKFEIEFGVALDKAKDPLSGTVKKDGGKGVVWHFIRR